MKKMWIAAAFAAGLALLVLSAQQAQQFQKPPVKKKIENLDIPKTPIGSITITNPKSTSPAWFAGGDLNTINWTKSGAQPDTVKIELRDKGCLGNIHTFTESTANDGMDRVVVPSSVAAGTYTIRISGGGARGCSEAFSVVPVPWKVTVPAGTWKIGSAQTVTWTTTQSAGTLLRLFLVPTTPAVDWYNFASSSPNDGSESLTVPGPAGTYRVRIEPQSGPYAGQSFSGGGPITIVP